MIPALSRRDLLKLSTAGVVSYSMSGWLKALADEGSVPVAKVAEAIKKYGINTDKINPLYA